VQLSGRYRLDHRIATGGMGEVWHATDEVLGRPVAVKLLRHAYLGDESLASRFRAEARYAAALSHPGIAQVFDYGEQDADSGGGAYLVMELVPGEPLSAILARLGRLSAGATLDIVAQAACALQAAHVAGIVHRDIKPGNLIVTAAGRVKITDFGIARAIQAAQAAHLTQTGMVMGTAQYVSPEQASGLRVTHASDIYSLGIVAYECLTGAPPFAADALIALALAHVREPPPPLPPGVPTAVAALVMRMLAKRPEDRQPSAQAVADRAGLLRGALPAAGGLAEVAAGEPGSWLAGDSATGPRSRDGATSQLPANDPDRLPRGYQGSARRRAFVAAASGTLIIGVATVTTALMLGGHHAAITDGPGTQPTTAGASSGGHHHVRPGRSQHPLIHLPGLGTAPVPTSPIHSVRPDPAPSPSSSPAPSSTSPSPTVSGTAPPSTAPPSTAPSAPAPSAPAPTATPPPTAE
jgi:serine/threonine-protein kinase